MNCGTCIKYIEKNKNYCANCGSSTKLDSISLLKKFIKQSVIGKIILCEYEDDYIKTKHILQDTLEVVANAYNEYKYTHPLIVNIKQCVFDTDIYCYNCLKIANVDVYTLNEWSLQKYPQLYNNSELLNNSYHYLNVNKTGNDLHNNKFHIQNVIYFIFDTCIFDMYLKNTPKITQYTNKITQYTNFGEKIKYLFDVADDIYLHILDKDRCSIPPYMDYCYTYIDIPN